MWIGVLWALVGVAQAQTPDLQERLAARDGTELATDVYLPEGAGPFPVLLRRTPYGRAVDTGLVEGTGSLGYALVSQDVRGRGDSDGEFLPFFDDATDGADTLDWIVEQPWSNGRVGTFGGSAEGIVQLMLLGEAHPAHACAHVTVATDDVHEILYPGGVWRTELTDRWLEALMEPAARTTLRMHEARDAFWDRARTHDDERARVRIPVMHVGGFFDIFSVGTPRTFASLAAQAMPEGRDGQLLVLGAWTHGGLGTPTQGEITWGMDAVYGDNVAELVAFLGWCLKGEARPDLPRVRYYLSRLGDDGTSATGEWRSDDVWPPASTSESLYLRPDGLGRSPAAADAPTRVLPVDPSDPVPSTGGSAFTERPGPHDQAALDARPDVLALDTPAAEEPVVIAGDLVAHVWAASSTTDADVIVRVSQVTPSGRVMLLADGGRRGRFAESLETAGALVPGEPTLFSIDVGPIAIELPPGHRLRISVSGTLAPRFEVNPGMPTPLSETPTPVAHELSIFWDSDHPSTLVVPVVSGTLPGPAPPLDADAGAPPPDAGAADDAGSPGSRDAGTDVRDADSPGGRGDEGGCGCRIAGSHPRDGTRGWIALVVVCWIVVRARRRRLLRSTLRA
ncbi:MAG: CocE/NonD family hydrolase [Deltaproteobacteria bacterium]|nr:CocE/NonD family hydrolase [Deltaproteobacteria bacterium]